MSLRPEGVLVLEARGSRLTVPPTPLTKSFNTHKTVDNYLISLHGSTKFWIDFRICHHLKRARRCHPKLNQQDNHLD
jgi:hypothetical protein